MLGESREVLWPSCLEASDGMGLRDLTVILKVDERAELPNEEVTEPMHNPEKSPYGL